MHFEKREGGIKMQEFEIRREKLLKISSQVTNKHLQEELENLI